MATTFRDRFFTRRTADALTSPASIVAAGAGTAVAILAGAPVLAAPVVGAAAYAFVVARRMPRADAGPRIDPRTLGQPWRTFVSEALDAKHRFTDAVELGRAGPLQSRLQRINERIDDGVRECWRIAQHGQALEVAMERLEPGEKIRDRLGQVREELRGAAGDKRRRLEQTADALEAQEATEARLRTVVADAQDRLQLLDARLDEAVARTIELSLRATDPSDLGDVSGDVDTIVGELEALRLAMEETDRAALGQA